MLYYDQLGDKHRGEVEALFGAVGNPRLFGYELGRSGAVISRRPLPATTAATVNHDLEYLLVHLSSGEYMESGRSAEGRLADYTTTADHGRAFVAPGYALAAVRWERDFRTVPVGDWGERAAVEEAEARHLADLADRRDRRDRLNVSLVPRPAELLLEEARGMSLTVCEGDSKEVVVAAILFATFGYVELPGDDDVRELYGGSYTVEDVLHDTDFGEQQRAAEIVLGRFLPSTPFVSAWGYLPDFVRYAALEYDRAFRSAHMID
jgi:hypothetical protein